MPGPLTVEDARSQRGHTLSSFVELARNKDLPWGHVKTVDGVEISLYAGEML